MFKLVTTTLVIFGLLTTDHWVTGETDLPNDLALYAVNVTCNDRQSVCVHCFREDYNSIPNLQVFEYTANPSKIQVNLQVSGRTGKWTFTQEDSAENYRLCHLWDSEATGPFGHAFKGAICLTNDFTGIAMPSAGCARPIALITKEGRINDYKIQGQEVLYCMPQP